MGETRENRTETLGITILSILEATLRLLAKNSETLGQIADNRAQTRPITILAF